jgi:hypothetical protein
MSAAVKETEENTNWKTLLEKVGIVDDAEWFIAAAYDALRLNGAHVALGLDDTAGTYAALFKHLADVDKNKWCKTRARRAIVWSLATAIRYADGDAFVRGYTALCGLAHGYPKDANSDIAYATVSMYANVEAFESARSSAR